MDGYSRTSDVTSSMDAWCSPPDSGDSSERQKMKHVNLLISAIPEVSLDVLAKRIFSLVQADSYEERSSVNHVEDHYYVGRTARMELKVMLSDDSDHSDLPYWVRLSATGHGDLEEAEIEKVVHDRILPAGLRVARVENFGQVSEVRVDYKP